MFKLRLSLILLLILSLGCARWGVAPRYEPVGSLAARTSKKVYVGEIQSTLVSKESNVNILGFTIDPVSFLRRDIGQYLSDAVEREGSEIFYVVKSNTDADYEISGKVLEFSYKMKVEEVPMRGEGYAYFYSAEFHITFRCLIEQKGTMALEKTYTADKQHATIYHTLTNWEIPFTEDLNLVVFDVVEDILKDLSKKF